jgi:hypothetical protein
LTSRSAPRCSWPRSTPPPPATCARSLRTPSTRSAPRASPAWCRRSETRWRSMRSRSGRRRARSSRGKRPSSALGPSTVPAAGETRSASTGHAARPLVPPLLFHRVPPGNAAEAQG